MARPARALLSARALRDNLAEVRRLAPSAKIMAVVKANGYGHGLEWVARTLSTADAFGVACPEEGIQLRAAGIEQPICVLEGFSDPSEIPLLTQHRLSAAIHHETQLGVLEQDGYTAPLSVWLKIDTGMHRLGFTPAETPAVLARLKACRCVTEIRLMSHLANADRLQDVTTRAQIDCFKRLTNGVALERALANSAGVLAWPESHMDWVRPGIMLYGASPLEGTVAGVRLAPVMTLVTALIAVKRYRQGDAIGYGGDWRCPEDMPVGVAAIGYGDGYPRHAPSGTPVMVNGVRAALIGRVSMDMITLDLRTQPAARVGDPVMLWGPGLPVEEVAERAGTIAYELLCHVTERIPRTPVSD